MLYFTLTYLTVAVLSVLVFVYGKDDPKSWSVFDVLYRLFARALPRVLKACAGACCGARGPRALDSAWDYSFNQGNPLIQFFYLAIMLGTYVWYAARTLSGLPMLHVPAWHGPSISVVFFSCIGSWMLASFSDPGFIKTKNQVDWLLKYRPACGMIFDDQDACKTCEHRKPARSKHCSLCRGCVANMDHHCVWLNNCVGLNNKRWFFLFLFLHQLVCVYCVWISYGVLASEIEEKRLWKMQFVDRRTHAATSATYSVLVRYFISQFPSLVVVGALCGFMSFVILGFTMYNLNLARKGVTANELDKWRRLRGMLEMQSKLPVALDSASADEERKKRLDARRELEQIENLYDRGAMANLKEVFFPPSMPAAKAAADSAGGKPVKRNMKASGTK